MNWDLLVAYLSGGLVLLTVQSVYRILNKKYPKEKQLTVDCIIEDLQRIKTVAGKEKELALSGKAQINADSVYKVIVKLLESYEQGDTVTKKEEMK